VTTDKPLRFEENTRPIKGGGRDCVLTCNLFLEISTWWKDQIKKAPQSSLRVHGGKWTVDQIGTCPMEARVGKGVKSRANTRDLRPAVE